MNVWPIKVVGVATRMNFLSFDVAEIYIKSSLFRSFRLAYGRNEYPIAHTSFMPSPIVEPRAGGRKMVPEGPQIGAGRLERAPSLR